MIGFRQFRLNYVAPSMVICLLITAAACNGSTGNSGKSDRMTDGSRKMSNCGPEVTPIGLRAGLRRLSSKEIESLIKGKRIAIVFRTAGGSEKAYMREEFSPSGEYISTGGRTAIYGRYEVNHDLICVFSRNNEPTKKVIFFTDVSGKLFSLRVGDRWNNVLEINAE